MSSRGCFPCEEKLLGTLAGAAKLWKAGGDAAKVSVSFAVDDKMGPKELGEALEYLLSMWPGEGKGEARELEAERNRIRARRFDLSQWFSSPNMSMMVGRMRMPIVKQLKAMADYEKALTERLQIMGVEKPDLGGSQHEDLAGLEP